jgi:hypothetical protein
MARKTSKKGSATAPAIIKTAIRRQMAVELRLQGGTFRQIAETMRSQEGISPSYDERHAHEDVAAELDRVRLHTSESAEQVKARQLLQVQELLAGIWPYAKQGDVASFDRVLKALDYEARLLGLFPQQSKESNPRGASASGSIVESNGATLTVREVIVQLNGVDDQNTSNIIDATPSNNLIEINSDNSVNNT